MQQLVNILSSFLGKPKHDFEDGGGLIDKSSSQLQFNCPVCRENNMGVETNSYHLEVNLIKSKYLCWKCQTEGTYGRIGKLIKQYGGVERLNEYKAALKEIKETRLFQLDLSTGEKIIIEDVDDEDKVKFVDHVYEFDFKDNNEIEKTALNYLLLRGFSKEQITKYNLKYTTGDCFNKLWNYRIIIPSYDKHNTLNYYTGRDYSGTSKMKYLNCEDFERKEIIFNEKFLEWNGDIVLIEGPLDHLSVPNSAPIMGKSLNRNHYLFECLLKFSTQDITVFLDNDAIEDAKNICKKLSDYGLCGRVKFVDSEQLRIKINQAKHLNLKKLDPNVVYEKFGYKGVIWCLKQATYYECW